MEGLIYNWSATSRPRMGLYEYVCPISFPYLRQRRAAPTPPSHLGHVVGGEEVNAVSIARGDSHSPDIPATSQTPPLLSLSPLPAGQHSLRRRIRDDAEGSTVSEIRCHQSATEVANSE